MEPLLIAAGASGLALLLQAKSPLPSEADYKKALEKLKENAQDPDANTIAGKYEAFVIGDYSAGMAHLVNSGDKNLRTLAEHERAPLYTDSPVKKVGMGDEWVKAAKDFPVLSRIFYDRAGQWYTAAWPDLDLAWKERSRTQGMKLATARPVGGPRKGLPPGWKGDINPPGAKMPILDGTISHTGSYSVKLLPPDEKVKDGFSQLVSDVMAVPAGKELEFSAMVMSNGTENANDQMVVYGEKNGTFALIKRIFIPLDTPFWNPIVGKIDISDGTSRISFGIIQSSKKGNIWIDDVGFKVDGKYVMKPHSFEP